MESTVTEPATFKGMVTKVRRELLILGITGVAFLATLPFAFESNPEHDAAQEFLDGMAAATAAVVDGDAAPGDYTVAGDGFTGDSVELDDTAVGFVLVGAHGNRCFLVHWQAGGAGGPRAGVLDPALRCDATADLMSTLPTPPLVEAFPGTVPPLDAADLVTAIDAERVFPEEQTRSWFLPVALILLTVALWHFVGLTLKLLRRGRLP